MLLLTVLLFVVSQDPVSYIMYLNDPEHLQRHWRSEQCYCRCQALYILQSSCQLQRGLNLLD